MRAAHRQVIDHPSAWTAAGLGGKQALVLELDAAQLDAIDALLERSMHLAPQQIRRAEFDHPALNRLMDRVREVLLHGRGALILGGLGAERYGEEELRRIYTWGPPRCKACTATGWGASRPPTTIRGSAATAARRSSTCTATRTRSWA
jgi:hypothetical protein